MTIEQTLLAEIDESNKWLDREQEEGVYKRDLMKRIELLNWVLENMKKPDNNICDLIESRMNNVVLTINQIHDILEADELDSELRILYWIFYQVCISQQPSIKEGTI